MRRIPVDLSGLTFIAGSAPEGVMDMERRPRADKATGELLWQLDLVVLGLEDGADIWPTRVAGEPKGVTAGQLLQVEGLTALRGDGRPTRHELPARAIEPAGASAASEELRAGGLARW